ncbi:class I adenylate-forming enzyme family protein [Ilumatobacter coccineus]|jgi:long-chain acyl-CoA synthetase|uniref:Putative 4-coumarate--CoA ligase n=1 Tax=Ilumatobacter coccineus (strain NBRC 103263 / KCTC 29153 / YM16-304) TaxID=1313172 RepID=A0A6C7EAL5_ILUCY|nr:AMP-binding protein [Ilumatobacter coccineus]BAN03420.1 putative 4-coumarate--CoA ligase [Ilumatobacter coccineus YM16-304]
MNLATVIERHDASRVALIEGDQRVTYGEFRERVGRLRTQLKALGVDRSDVVVVAAGNEIHFATSAIALLGIGAIPMPLNPSSTSSEMVAKIAVGKPKLILAGKGGQRVTGYAGDLDVEVIDLVELDAASVDVEPDHSVVDLDPSDRAFYMATSGVSGSPKVAMLSHGNLDWVQNLLVTGDDPVTSDDVMLGVLPFAHIFGLNVVLLTSLRAGACVVLQRSFDETEGLRLIREHGVTLVSGAPPMWQRWLAADGPDDSMATVRHASSGAAALPVGVFEQVRDRFGFEIKQGYGLTETSPVVTMGRDHPTRPSSVGKVVDGVSVALVDMSGRPVDVGDEGEVVVRSPGVFLGYLDDQDTTDSVLTADGWLWTGDVGIFDEDGYLYLVDRIKDVVIVSGFNVYPAEVENVLMKHPEVTGAIVTGSDDPDTGECVVAHVTGSATQSSLEAFVAEHLSRYKRPTQYHFLDVLPIAATGKAIRRELRS